MSVDDDCNADLKEGPRVTVGCYKANGERLGSYTYVLDSENEAIAEFDRLTYDEDVGLSLARTRAMVARMKEKATD